MIDIILLHASHAKIQASRFSNFDKETSVCKIQLMSKIWLNWYWRQVWDYGAELREWSLTSLSVTSVSKLCHQDNYVTNINVSSIYRLFKLHETSDGLGNNCPGWLLIWPRNQPTQSPLVQLHFNLRISMGTLRRRYILLMLPHHIFWKFSPFSWFVLASDLSVSVAPYSKSVSEKLFVELRAELVDFDALRPIPEVELELRSRRSSIAGVSMLRGTARFFVE